eukprot:5025633-Prymnesium_polylepis.4
MPRVKKRFCGRNRWAEAGAGDVGNKPAVLHQRHATLVSEKPDPRRDVLRRTAARTGPFVAGCTMGTHSATRSNRAKPSRPRTAVLPMRSKSR